MYNWLVWLHVLFSLLLMLTHGVHAAAMLAFRKERDPERSLTFFNIVPDIRYVRYVTVLMALPGLAAAFVLPWWKQGWPWASAGIFVVVSVVMYQYGAGYFGLIQEAAEGLIAAQKAGKGIEEARGRFEAARTAPHTLVVSIVGIVGLAAILWLMRFKPF